MRKCFLVFLFLLSGDIQLNPGSAPFINVNATSPLDVYEPFFSPSYSKLRVPTLNARSISNKFAVICDHILENKFAVLSLSETWINDGQMTKSLLISPLPSYYCLSQYYGRPQLSRGGGVAIINYNSIHHTAISIPSFSSFECISSVITSSNSSFKLFLFNFNRYLNYKLLLKLIYFFIGDLKLHIEDLNDYNARHFFKLLNTFDFLPYVTLPTYDSEFLITI